MLIQVHGILLGEHLGLYDTKDGSIPIGKAAHVHGIAFFLLGQISLTPLEGSDITCINVGSDRGLTGRRSGIGQSQAGGRDFRQAIAGFVFEFRIFRQGNTNGIAQTIGEERTNTNCRFHASVFSFSRLGDTQMERIIPAETILLGRQKTIRLHHNEWVTGFHGEYKVMEIQRTANIGKFNGGFHHTAGGISIKGQDPGGEGAVIGSDAHTTVQGFTLLYQRFQSFYQVGAFREVVFLGLINLFLKILATIGEIARIDANLLHGISDHECHDGLKMHIRTKRNIIALLKESLPNFHTGVGLAFALHRDADQIKALVGTAHDLLNGGVHVRRIGGGHGLSHNRMLRAKLNGTTAHGAGRAAHHFSQIFAILTNGAKDTIAFAGSDGRSPLDIGDGR